MNKKKYMVDTIATTIFWAVAWTIIYLIQGLPVDIIINLSIWGAVLNAVLAGTFGKYLDKVRSRFNVG